MSDGDRKKLFRPKACVFERFIVFGGWEIKVFNTKLLFIKIFACLNFHTKIQSFGFCAFSFVNLTIFSKFSWEEIYCSFIWCDIQRTKGNLTAYFLLSTFLLIWVLKNFIFFFLVRGNFKNIKHTEMTSEKLLETVEWNKIYLANLHIEVIF